MRKRWVLAAAAILTAATVIGAVAVASSANQAVQNAQDPRVNTAKVEQGNLSATVSMYGTLNYRAQPDGSPYSVINQARGTYTSLPEAGDKVACGTVFYRVNDYPVLLLCGTVPAYRDLHSGDVGNDVRQLNQNLHALGYDATAGVAINPADNNFTGQTQKALEVLQHSLGVAVTGQLGIDGAVFLPEPVRIARVVGELGGSAQPGAQVLSATSDTLEVEVNLDASQQGDVKPGNRARITLPGNLSVTGKVDRLGRVAQVPAGQNQDVGAATIPAYISLDDQKLVAGLDQAPVQVEITTTGVTNTLSVPLTAIIGRSGGGFAVEVVRAGGQHELVAVELGLVDSAAGRVQVTGDLREGDDVVVPSI
jgi:peptidoglycan hydrolase-like protein with peptidoglycan-binding domain